VELSNKIHRRAFLGSTLAALPAMTQTGQRRSPSDVFRVGCLNVVDYSHLNDIWAPFINPRAGKKDAPFTGMRITHCWEIDRTKAEEFAKAYGCQAVKNFDDMVGKVDGIINGGYYNYPWNHILHQPYLEAGLPNLINRPFANSLAKAQKMIETARKYRATILVPSAFEYNDPMARAKAWASGKKIICYNATNSTDDYATHGVHGVYMISWVVADAGNPVVSVAYRAKNWWNLPGLLTFEHRDKDGRQFFGSLHLVSDFLGTMQIYTTEEHGGQIYEKKNFAIRAGTGFPFDKTELWAPTIWVFENMAMNGDMPQTFEQIYQKTNVFLAGFKSILENDGKPVKLEEVPEEWASPVELPDRPGDPTVSLFEKKFGSATRNP